MNPPADVIIRLAEPADCPAISELLQQAFAAFRPQYTSRAFAATAIGPAAVLQRLAEGPVWIATLRDVIRGTVSTVLTNRGMYIRGMAVHPEARGRKIGYLLLLEAEQFALDQGCHRLYLSTTPFLDRAIALYERLGFQRIGEGPAALFGTPLFTMEKLLEGQ